MPGPADVFLLIDNDGVDAVEGTFSNDPGGGDRIEFASGVSGIVHYDGGDGNDVTITDVRLPGRLRGSLFVVR